MARSRSRTSTSPARRRRVWADTTFVAGGITTTAQQDLLLHYRAQPGAVGSGLTIGGVLINWNVSVAGTANDGTAVRLGLHVGQAGADPIDDPYLDWMWNSEYHTRTGTGPVGWDNTEDQHLRIRSRRRCDELNETLWMAMSVVLDGATTLSVTAHVRTLLILP